MHTLKILIRFVIAWVSILFMVPMVITQWVLEDDPEYEFAILKGWWHWATFQ